MTKRKIDVQVSGGFGIYLISPLTPKASRWVKANVQTDSWQWVGGGFAVDDRRMAMNLCDGMIQDGLIVR